MKTEVNFTLNNDKSTTRLSSLSTGDFFYFDNALTELYQKVLETSTSQYVCISSGDLYTQDSEAFDPIVYKVKSVDIRVTL